MRIPRVYADTSVFGGVFDEEFRVPSTRFFDQVRRGCFALVTSTLVREEMQAAPPQVREFFLEVTDPVEFIGVSEEAARLQAAYVEAGVVTERSMADALHVALATVAGCDLVVSWNFRHIVNYHRIPMYNAVNTLRGFGDVTIFSPLEVIADEDEDV